MFRVFFYRFKLDRQQQEFSFLKDYERELSLLSQIVLTQTKRVQMFSLYLIRSLTEIFNPSLIRSHIHREKLMKRVKFQWTAKVSFSPSHVTFSYQSMPRRCRDNDTIQ